MAQQPIHGRRKTEKDRRPLAHCPIVRLRLKECRRITDRTMRGHPDWEEGWEEEEIDVSYVTSMLSPGEYADAFCAEVLNLQISSALPTYFHPTKLLLGHPRWGRQGQHSVLLMIRWETTDRQWMAEIYHPPLPHVHLGLRLISHGAHPRHHCRYIPLDR